MEIKKAIWRTRKEAAALKMRAAHYRLMGAGMIELASDTEWNAKALETVCNKLEALLAEQEAKANGD